MISSKRKEKAEREGKEAAIACSGDPWMTQNPYYPWSAQGKAFSRGFSYIRNNFPFILKC